MTCLNGVRRTLSLSISSLHMFEVLPIPSVVASAGGCWLGCLHCCLWSLISPFSHPQSILSAESEPICNTYWILFIFICIWRGTEMAQMLLHESECYFTPPPYHICLEQCEVFVLAVWYYVLLSHSMLIVWKWHCLWDCSIYVTVYDIPIHLQCIICYFLLVLLFLIY